MKNAISLSHKNLCPEVLDQFNEYIDGDLATELCEELEQRIQECPDCQVFFDTFTKTIRLYRTLDDAPTTLSPDIEQRLMQRLNTTACRPQD